MSKEEIKLKAKKRDIVGRKVKKLRREGILPANVFGKKSKSQSISVDLKEFTEVFKKAGETGLVSLEIEGSKEPKHALVHNITLNPVTDVFVHADFLEVDLSQKVEANVKVTIVGESPAEKQALGTVVTQLNEIEVEALPMDLPDQFEVNIEELTEVDQAIYVKDLKYDKSKVTIITDPESIVVKVEPPQKEEVIETPVVEEGEEGVEGAPAEGEGEAKEGGEENKEEPRAEEGGSDQSA